MLNNLKNGWLPLSTLEKLKVILTILTLCIVFDIFMYGVSNFLLNSHISLDAYLLTSFFGSFVLIIYLELTTKKMKSKQ